MAMKASERRKAYGLRRIVISQHNYFALKKLGQMGDSFNDVITNLLLIQRNYQKEKEEEKKRKQEQNLQLQEKSCDEQNNGSITNNINPLYSQSFIDEVMEKHRQQMDEIFRTIEEKQE